ncbi:MAG: endolytic transglycosylase MltG [Candidatus Pacebacteria bacterium]|nr:endolytic transglycosylase MltG [Candidatus Paceibacterota bacterium]
MNWKILSSLLVILSVFSVLLFEFITPSSSKEDDFVLNRGDNIFKVSTRLKADGYIGSKMIFLSVSMGDGSFRKIRAGTYELRKGMSNSEILRIITSGSPVIGQFIILPGNSIKEISYSLERNGICSSEEFMGYVLDRGKWGVMQEEYLFLKDIPDKGSLEGYLFPDTYHIDRKSSPDRVVDMILANFRERTKSLKTDGNKHGAYEIMIMASILEKEVISLDDKKLVAGLLWKRLAGGYPLEVDSTLIYFRSSDHPSVNDKNIDSLYNTYNHGGLPVGPISNPSLESIEAAIDYQESDYWFYLSASDGKTIFSKNYGEHLINKAKFLDK